MASAQTSKGPAPGDKNDGSDYSFRMVIDDRYKEMAKMKRNLKIASKVQTWYILVRSAWKFSPSLLYGIPFSMIDVGILIAGIGVLFFYRYAFGYGKAQHEKLKAIMACTIMNMLLMAECFLTFWVYHINFGPKSRHEEAAASYPPIPRGLIGHFGLSGSAASTALAILDPFEKAMDVVGIAAFLVSTVVMREYALETREQKREQEERKAAALKVE